MDAEENTIKIRRRIHAVPARVYEALTTPDLAKHWWGGGLWHITGLTLDAKPGGRFEFNMKNSEDGAEYHTHGEYKEAIPNERLVWTNAEGDGTIVEIDLSDDGGATEIRVKQGPFADAESCRVHAQGWNASLDQLDALLQD